MRRRKRMMEELDEDIREHIARETQDNIDKGMTPEEARKAAVRKFGNVTKVKEETREVWSVVWLEQVLQDICFGVRMLRKSPGFTAVAVLGLALGIGASTVGFSVFYNLLFNAFDAKDASRLAVPMIESADPGPASGESLDILPCSLSDFDATRAAFEDIACHRNALALVNDGKETRQLQGAYVTANAFEFYGVPALLGRGIVPADGKAGAQPVFVMSYKTWNDQFGLTPSILGKSFTVNGELRALVGIMPPRFEAYGALTEIWVPINADDAATPQENLYILARLHRGETLGAASAEMNVIVRRLAKANPTNFPKHFTVRVQSAADFLMGPWGIGSAGGSKFGLKEMLYALLAGVMILLLISCTNVANLLLARATVRGQEIAVRAALGATRWRLTRQLLAESVLLAGAACIVGCVLAYFGLKGVSAILPQKGIAIGGESVMSLDRAVLLFALAATLLTTLICGLAPTIQAVGRDLRTRLASGGKTVGGNARHGRLRSALVIGEIALSIVLLVGAGLLVRSFFVLTHVPLGFDPSHLVFAAFGQASWVPENSKNSGSAIFHQEILQRLKMLPGVADVAINNSLLGYNTGRHSEVTAPGATGPKDAGFDGCSANLLSTLGLHLLRGRWLTANDVASVRHVAVLNETMAHEVFGDTEAVGRQIEAKAFGQPPNAAAGRFFQVIGVAQDTTDYDGPEQPVKPMAYIPYTVEGYALFLVKTKAPTASMMHAIRQQVWAVDPNVFQDLEPVPEILYRLTYSAPKFAMAAVSPLSGIALLLVVAGLFSVMAYTVSLQTHEIGIRMALGAQQGNILGMVLLRGLRLVAAGIVVGVVASLELTRFIASQIWGVSATDPATFVSVAILLTIVALAACWIPARRAMRIEPMEALRYE
jgi:predicted permease